MFKKKSISLLLGTIVKSNSLSSSSRQSTTISSSNILSDLYFRQLVVGRDFASGRTNIHHVARQMNNYVYIVGDKTSHEAIVVDAAWDPESIEQITHFDNMTITSHVATHYHWDHIGGNANGMVVPGMKYWADLGLPVYISSLELLDASKQTGVNIAQMYPLEGGQCIRLGRFNLEFIHTPGHSPGSMCILVADGITTKTNGTDIISSLSNSSSNQSFSAEKSREILLITGDTLFPGSCGRLDLPGSDARVMYDSLRKLASLPDTLPIYPGHGYNGKSSTIGKEKTNGLLREMTLTQWAQMMI